MDDNSQNVSCIKGLGEYKLKNAAYQKLRSLPTFPFFVKDGFNCFVRKKEDDYWLVVFSTYVSVKEKWIDLDTNEVKVLLEFDNGNTIALKNFKSEIYDKNSVKELFNYGIRFEEKNISVLIKFLIQSESEAPIKHTYSRLGWSRERGYDVFRSGIATISKGTLENYVYSGSLDLNAVGSLEEWCDVVEEEVLWSKALTFVLILGFASPILSYLNQFQNIGTIMFNLSKQTSKGKTTAAMLAASVFSNPTMNKGSMITYHGTENAIVQFVSALQGHTVIIDECAMANSTDFVKLMYTICNGRSKMRLNGDATQKEVNEFSSVVISTAEFDLIGDRTPDGIRARVFEIKNQLTRNAANSDAIKKCVIANYGVAGRKFIELLTKDLDSILLQYEEDKEALIKMKDEKTELTDRILSKLAVLLTTAKFVRKYFGFDIDYNEFSMFLLKIEADISKKPTESENLLEVIKQEVSNAYGHYITETNSSPNQCYGKIDIDGNYSEIVISEKEFKRIVLANKIKRYKDILKALKINGVLLTENDRLYKRVVLIKDIGREKCYCFKVQNDEYKKDIKIERESFYGDVVTIHG